MSEPDIEQFIDTNYHYLVNRIYVADFFGWFRSKNVFSQTDQEIVEHKTTTVEKVGVMLDILKRKGLPGFNAFKEVLEYVYPFVFEMLFKTQARNPPTGWTGSYRKRRSASSRLILSKMTDLIGIMFDRYKERANELENLIELHAKEEEEQEKREQREHKEITILEERNKNLEEQLENAKRLMNINAKELHRSNQLNSQLTKAKDVYMEQVNVLQEENASILKTLQSFKGNCPPELATVKRGTQGGASEEVAQLQSKNQELERIQGRNEKRIEDLLAQIQQLKNERDEAIKNNDLGKEKYAEQEKEHEELERSYKASSREVEKLSREITELNFLLATGRPRSTDVREKPELGILRQNSRPHTNTYRSGVSISEYEFSGLPNYSTQNASTNGTMNDTYSDHLVVNPTFSEHGCATSSRHNMDHSRCKTIAEEDGEVDNVYIYNMPGEFAYAARPRLGSEPFDGLIVPHHCLPPPRFQKKFESFFYALICSVCPNLERIGNHLLKLESGMIVAITRQKQWHGGIMDLKYGKGILLSEGCLPKCIRYTKGCRIKTPRNNEVYYSPVRPYIATCQRPVVLYAPDDVLVPLIYALEQSSDILKFRIDEMVTMTMEELTQAIAQNKVIHFDKVDDKFRCITSQMLLFSMTEKCTTRMLLSGPVEIVSRMIAVGIHPIVFVIKPDLTPAEKNRHLPEQKPLDEIKLEQRHQKHQFGVLKVEAGDLQDVCRLKDIVSTEINYEQRRTIWVGQTPQSSTIPSTP